MTAKLTIDQIKLRMEKSHSSIQLLAKEYNSNSTPLLCRCKICEHNWSPTWSNLQKGQGCSNCYNTSRNHHLRLTLEEIQDRLGKIDPNIHITSKSYINAAQHLDVSCRVCGHVWMARWNNLMQGKGCRKCYDSQRRKTIWDKLLVSLSKRHIELVSDSYDRVYQRLEARCTVCDHIWTCTADNLLRRGCHKCHVTNLGKQSRVSNDDIRKRRKIPMTIDITYQYRGLIKLICSVCHLQWIRYWQNVSPLCPICDPHSVWIKEEEVRAIIERLSGWKFPHTSETNPSPINMELDGYNAEHQVAFERQGEWHYHPHWSYASKPKAIGEAALRRQKLRDHKKDMRCRRAGIILIRVPYFKRDAESFIAAKLKLSC